MIHKEMISLARLAGKSKAKELAKTLAGKSPTSKNEAWTKTFSASGAKVGGKNRPPGATNQ